MWPKGYVVVVNEKVVACIRSWLKSKGSRSTTKMSRKMMDEFELYPSRPGVCTSVREVRVRSLPIFRARTANESEIVGARASPFRGESQRHFSLQTGNYFRQRGLGPKLASWLRQHHG